MSFPRYPKYKDSGVEWLGAVPEHWEVIKLKRRFQIIGGSTPKSENESFWDGDILWATPSDLSKLNSLYLNETQRKITTAGLASCGTTLVEANSIILSTRAPIGSLAIAAVPICTNQGCKSLVASKSTDSKFFAYLLSISSTELNVRGKGTTFLELSGDELGGFNVPAPPYLEQTAIAAFLDQETAKIDALVAEQQRLKELLKEKRQAVISHAVTRGLNPAAPLKDSGIEWLGQVPEHWEVKRIRHFVQVLRGKFTHRPRNDPAFYDGAFPFVQTGDITGASRYITEFKQTLNERGASVSKEFPKGTLIMAIAANIGDVAILNFPAYFPDSIVGLVPSKSTNLLFLYFLMIGMKQPMLRTATVSTQMNLNVDQICSLSAASPPWDEQCEIVRHLDIELSKIDKLTAEAQNTIDLLQERRSALISAAVTGQIKVS